MGCVAEFELLRQELKHYLNDAEILAIEQAYLLAKEPHEGQLRHTGEAYITHPIAVATSLPKRLMRSCFST